MSATTKTKTTTKTAGKPLTKTELVAAIAAVSALPKKDVAVVLAGLTEVVTGSLNDSVVVTLPGLLKLKAVKKPGKPAREGINPFTKAPTTFKATPAKTVVKAIPLKQLKDSLS